jgi:hypothetical protein
LKRRPRYALTLIRHPLVDRKSEERARTRRTTVLTEDQKAHYEKVRKIAHDEMEAFDREIASELVRIKKRLLELQEDKKAVKQVFDGASARLGLELSPPLREISLSDLKKPFDQSPFIGEATEAAHTRIRAAT